MSRPPTSDRAERPPKRSPSAGGSALWFGLLGGTVAWVLHLGASYAVVPWVCADDRVWVLHLLTLLMALVAAASTASAARVWRRGRGSHGHGSPSSAGDLSRARDPSAPGALDAFLGLFGLFLSGFFLLLILVEGLPALLSESPCAYIPTLDQPIVQHVPGAILAGLPLPLLHVRGPVAPGEAWLAWNPDPWILGGLLVATSLYLAGVRRLWQSAGEGRGLSRRRVGAYLAGIWVLVLALVSPVDALGETLFSVHMVQHMLLMVVAAPLLVAGQPLLGYLWAFPEGWRQGLGRGVRRTARLRRGGSLLVHPVTVLLVHVAALWIWHVPALYQAALLNPGLHVLEHATYLGTAVLFWWALSRAGQLGRGPGYGAGILYVFGAALQSGALGALLLFSPRPWYPAHAPGAELWGVDLLVDQQVAAALMWVPAGLVYTGAILVLFVAWLGTSERTVSRRERQGWGLPPRREAGSS